MQEMVILQSMVQTVTDTAQKTKRTFGVIMVQNMARLQNGMMLLQEKSYIDVYKRQLF